MKDQQNIGRPPVVSRALATANVAGQDTGLASFTFRSPESAAALSRLVSPKTAPRFDNKGQRTVERPNVNDLKGISSTVASHQEDAESILSLFSDVKIACEILISSIKSPNDMYNGEVMIDIKDNLHITPIAEKLLPLVRSYYKDIWNISQKFDGILRETLFGSGAFPVLVIPENSMSDLIYGTPNISVESGQQRRPVPETKRYAKTALKRWVIDHKGLNAPLLGTLGNPAIAGEKFSVENLLADGKRMNQEDSHLLVTDNDGKQHRFDSVVVTDNPTLLQLRDLTTLVRKSAAMENMEKVGKVETFSDRELAQMLYRNTTGRSAEFIKLKVDSELKRYSVGRPFIYQPPPECVVPVINRSRPDDPVGFMIITDGEGGFLSRKIEVNQFKALRNSIASQNAQVGNSGYGDMSSYLLNRTASYFNKTCEEVTLQQVNYIYAQILEADFAARFRNGYIGNEVTVADIKRITDLMMHRTLANEKTQIIFVPAEMMVYFTYDQRINGTGKNLLEDSMTISSLRAQLLFARVMGGIKNSIGRQKVSVEMDPDSPDPQGTYDMIKSEVIMARQANTAPTSINVQDILNQIQAMSLEFEVSGNEALPNTKIAFSESNNSNYNRPDPELVEELTDLMINHIGVPPEMVDEARRSSFATVAIASNILFGRRVRDMQERFKPQLSRLVTLMVSSDATFIIEIKRVIVENLKAIETSHPDLDIFRENQTALVNFLCTEFISNLVASLAKPDAKSIENNLEAMRKQREIYEMTVNEWASSNCIDPSYVGQLGFDSIDAFSKAIIAALMRRWMSENNIVPEIAEVFTEDDSGSRVWDISSSIINHAASVGKVLADIKSQVSRIAAATDLEMQKGIPTAEPESGGYTSPSPAPAPDSGGDGGGAGDGDDGGEGGGEGGLGYDDFNFDIPLG